MWLVAYKRNNSRAPRFLKYAFEYTVLKVRSDTDSFDHTETVKKTILHFLYSKKSTYI